MPNGSAYKINWELLMFPKGISSQVGGDLEIKRQKMVHFFPRYVCVKSSAYADDPMHRWLTKGHDFDLVIETMRSSEFSKINPSSLVWSNIAPFVLIKSFSVSTLNGGKLI